MKNLKKNLFYFVLLVFVFSFPLLSLAQADVKPPTSGSNVKPPTNESMTIVNPIKAESIKDLIKEALEAAIKIGMPIIVLAIIYSGFLFVAAQGNSEKLEEAKRALMFTLIGAAILLGSWAIAQLISETVQAL